MAAQSPAIIFCRCSFMFCPASFTRFRLLFRASGMRISAPYSVPFERPRQILRSPIAGVS